MTTVESRFFLLLLIGFFLEFLISKSTFSCFKFSHTNFLHVTHVAALSVALYVVQASLPSLKTHLVCKPLSLKWGGPYSRETSKT